MDHGEADRKRPTIHFLVQYVFVENDNSEAKDDPNRNIGVAQNNLLDNTGTGRAALTHNADFWLPFGLTQSFLKSKSGISPYVLHFRNSYP